MGLIQKGAVVQYKMLDALRHRDAFEVAAESAGTSGFEGLEGHHYCLLVSFKRSGDPVPSPVLFGLDSGRVYFRTDATVAKVKRIRNNPRVLVGPCNMRGKPKGPLAEGTARRLEGEKAERAHKILRDAYTAPMKVFEGGLDQLPVDITYFEVTPAAAEGAA